MNDRLSSEESVPCAICGVSETHPVLAGAGDATRRYPLVACDRCGLVFQRRPRTIQQLDEDQADAYGEPERRFGRLVEWGVTRFRQARVRLAERHLPPGGSVLDVGCGRGLFLRLLQERGYRVRGTELSRATAANAYPGVPVDAGELRPGRYPDGSFDLISIWHVLEHLREPASVLKTCHDALKPEGNLMIAVPNLASVQARLGGAGWFHLDLPRHVYHFTPDTLRRLLSATGYEIVSCRTGQWEMDPFGLLQSFLNRAGLRHNALYDTLRNNEAVKGDLGLLYRGAMIALFPVGMMAALPFSLLFRGLGRAGTLIVIARKPA